MSGDRIQAGEANGEDDDVGNGTPEELTTEQLKVMIERLQGILADRQPGAQVIPIRRSK